jgi:hypothetical protein
MILDLISLFRLGVIIINCSQFLEIRSVHIERILPPHMGVGVGEDGSEVMVLNGHLFADEKCEVILNGKLATLVRLEYSLDDLTDNFGDKDGLIKYSDLKEHRRSRPWSRIFELGQYICFPDYRCRRLFELACKQQIEQLSRIKISKSPVHAGAAVKTYGIDFISAIEKCLEEGLVKSYYYSLEKKTWEDGVSADFLVRMSMNKESCIELDAWQGIKDDGRLHYCHGILHTDGASFQHLDFAFHHTSKDEIEKLFSNGRDRPELSLKAKVFRLDDDGNSISFELAYELMKIFFPLDELVAEYFLKESNE